MQSEKSWSFSAPLLTEMQDFGWHPWVLPVLMGRFLKRVGYATERPLGTEEDWILIQCTEGEGRFQIGEERGVLVPGENILIPPHTPHIYRNSPQQSWSLEWVHFHIPSQDSLTLSKSKGSCDPAFFSQHFATMTELVHENLSKAKLLEISSLLQLLLARVLRSHHEERASGPLELAEIHRIMDDHLQSQLSLEALARSQHLSPWHFSRQFKAVTDQSPMMYFTRRRVAKAAELMLQPGARIKEVARVMGYDNPFSFSRQFKAVTGLSPRLWLLRQADAGVLRGS